MNQIVKLLKKHKVDFKHELVVDLSKLFLTNDDNMKEQCKDYICAFEYKCDYHETRM